MDEEGEPEAEGGPGLTSSSAASATRCPQCNGEVPPLEYCVRCGFRLEGEAVPARRSQRASFAAAPHEQAWSVHLVSTLFPQLPRTDMAFFGLTLAVGMTTVIGLAVAGFYPVALCVATILVPLVTLLYLYAVDVYENEPLLIVGLTMAWGAVAGVVLGLVYQHIGVPLGPPRLSALGGSDAIVRDVVLPLVGGGLALAGPLVLLRYRRFNDVLDGTTFGAATAVTLIGIETLVQAWPLASAGLRPAGAAAPWLVRLIEIGLLIPVIWAGALGTACAALWLRFRAPVRDRRALGPLGSPAIALLLAAVLVVAAPTGLQVLQRNPGFVWIAALALVSLVLLRRAIHTGLVEEADEIDIGPDVVCANCHRLTPRHTFCGRCGIALRALPKATFHGAADPTALDAAT